jgi:hypothetical protein
MCVCVCVCVCVCACVAQALAGLAADARQLANHAREEAQNYRSFYGSAIPGTVLADRMAYGRHDVCVGVEDTCPAVTGLSKNLL